MIADERNQVEAREFSRKVTARVSYRGLWLARTRVCKLATRSGSAWGAWDEKAPVAKMKSGTVFPVGASIGTMAFI
jgi:hypothetical protein